MKHTNRIVPSLTAFCGILGLLLLKWYFGLQDAAGLLPGAHPARILLMILCALYLVFLLVITRKTSADLPYETLFSRSVPGALCLALSGASLILFVVFSFLHHRGGLEIFSLVLGVITGLDLFLLAGCRMKGKNPGFLLTVIPVIASIFYTVYFTRGWGIDPQYILYLFPLLASLALMLGTYHYAALSQGKPSARSLQLYSNLALFFCLLALSSKFRLFYLAMGLMMISFTFTGQEEPEV